MGTVSSPKPWEYQPGIDENTSFGAFTWFLLLAPPRRLNMLAGQFQVAMVTLRKWAKDGLWYERARAYDQDLLRLRKEELDRVYQLSGAEVAQQQLDVIALGNSIVADQFEKLARRCLDTDSPYMRPADAVRLRAELFREERLVRGQATEIVESEQDLGKLSDDELAELDRLTRKARKDGTGT